MTDETRDLFEAPWYVFSSPDDEITVIENESGRVLAELDDVKTANRLARLPELYDALMQAARVYCPYASFDCRSEEECPHIQIRTGICKRCVALGWLDLLRKVRDGV